MSKVSERLAQLTPEGRALLIRELHSSLPAQLAQPTREKEPIAIIGIGCRFPGAENPDAFWRLLSGAVDAISEVPRERWNLASYYDPELTSPDVMNTRWGGFLEQVDCFDPLFFGISDGEAEGMDPQQRLLLEVAWEALENGAQAPDFQHGRNAGVFLGISSWDYTMLGQGAPPRGGTGMALSVAANRLSYFLNFHGPSMAVDTACSSSLVAVNLACHSLRSGDCELALAGGVNVILWPQLTVAFSQAGMLAPDGRCKTFDARANGYVRGEGCGVVVLKRLAAALADGDHIWAVLRGAAVNHNGRSNGLTAPQGLAQQAVIRRAIQEAGLTPAQIEYVEAHGTGTPLGDVIETQSLQAVLGAERGGNPPCAIGSVKTNIGHLEAAAGIAGLLKTVLALHHEEVPAHLHLQTPNPRFDWSTSGLRVAAEKRPWPRSSTPRRAGVSSFGFGGTNAHVVVEEAPLQRTEESSGLICGPAPVLMLSARSEQALKNLASRYVVWLNAHPKVSLDRVCFTAQAGRAHFNFRLAAVADGPGFLMERLNAFVRGEKIHGLYSGKASVGPNNLPPGMEMPGSPEASAQAYVSGQPLQSGMQEGNPGRLRVPLPTYPFERKRCWWKSQILESTTETQRHGERNEMRILSRLVDA